jgi:N6-L-threonylcarbamoyladenine synthase
MDAVQSLNAFTVRKYTRSMGVLSPNWPPGIIWKYFRYLWKKFCTMEEWTVSKVLTCSLLRRVRGCYGGNRRVIFPASALLVSGGHTSLFRMNSWEDILLLGSTRDDAAGEAFDKTAKIAGLGYPGGSALDLAADSGDPEKIHLPSPMADPSLPEFSFSGLKTAAKLLWEKGVDRNDLAASFRKTVVNILVSKLMFQSERFGVKSVLAAGGVTANSLLRQVLREECSDRNLNLYLPDREHATDNALMVGRAAAAILEQDSDAFSPLSCNAFSRWSGEKLSPIGCH